MATFAIALAAALLFGAGIGVLGMCGYLATSRIERAVVERRTAEVTGARSPGLWGRLWDAALRRVVRRLRRHRYARIAERTRALEVELGMVEPTIAEMFAPVVPMTSALAELRSGHAKNFFANGADIREHVQEVLFDMVSSQRRRRHAFINAGGAVADVLDALGIGPGSGGVVVAPHHPARIGLKKIGDPDLHYFSVCVCGDVHDKSAYLDLIHSLGDGVYERIPRYVPNPRLTARPCRECTAAPAHKQLHPQLQAATQLMAAGFQRRDAMEVAGLLDEPMMASDPSARDGFAWPKPDPRLTTRNSE